MTEAGMLHITREMIQRAVSRNAFQAGAAYCDEGAVTALFLSRDGRALHATVQGSARRPYQQTIRLHETRGGSASISGTCTCPVGFNCKHVAAALFAWHEQEEEGNSAGIAPNDRASASRSMFPVAAPSAATASLDPLSHQGAAASPAGTIPPQVTAWLNRLEALRQEEGEDYPPTVRRRLLYVLRADLQFRGLPVDLVGVELKRDGSLSSRSRRYVPSQLLYPGQQPRFLRPSDRHILRRLAFLNGPGEAGEETIETLRLILATGRGRWDHQDGPPLGEGPPVAGRLAWTVAVDGSQQLGLDLPDGLRTLCLAEPWYVDAAAGMLGPVTLDLPSRLAATLLGAPPLPPETVAEVQAELARRLPDLPLPLPKDMPTPLEVGGPPTPHLLLTSGLLPFDPGTFLDHAWPATARAPDPVRVPLARLGFRYGPVQLPPAYASISTIMRDGQIYKVRRDQAAEAAASRMLETLALHRLSNLSHGPGRHAEADAWLLPDPDPGTWIDFLLHDVPALRAAGWIVEVVDDFPIRLIEAQGDIAAQIQEASGIDWFDLDLGIMVEGERIDLLPALLDLLRQRGPDLSLPRPEPAEEGEDLPFVFPLPDGRLLSVPGAHLHGILALLLELFAGPDLELTEGRLRLPRARAADFALLEATGGQGGIAWQGGEAIRALGRQLRGTDGIPPSTVPDSFAASLRPYQQRGVDWLQCLRAAGLGGVLADDMGLGKTVQTLAHLAIEQAEGRLDRPALVVCPTSLVANWLAEAGRFAPSLRVLALHGRDRAQHFGGIGRHDLVITTYPLLIRDHAVLTEQEWHILVLDEAQTIKNPQAGTAKLAGRLRARQRLCLSGTPLENHLGELWSLFHFLMPGFLGDQQSFRRLWRTPIERGGDAQRQALLARRVSPFLLRRTKAEVAGDLPPRTEILEVVELGSGQRALYESIRMAMHAKVRKAIEQHGLARSGIIILDALLKLRQACCDPRLLKLSGAKPQKARSAKLDRLLEMLPALLGEGRRILLFSQFTSMLALIEAELDRGGIAYVKLTGETRDRATPVRHFQSGEVPLFLISLKAGGVGLNLTAADTVIHYDPWWNPAVEDQATDRAHRIGQDKPVFVHRLIAEGTIEAKMETLKARKQAIVAGILGGAAGTALAITEDDLEDLFASQFPT